jgi:pyruvate-ferredoxin/flavodoxin oxidoreductase
VAHWCATEARFRNHLKKIRAEDAEALVPLENMLLRITQQDVVYRRHLDPKHRAYVPDFGVYIKVQGVKGEPEYRALSRQLVLFCVERRKAWRMLQSKAGIENRDYTAQRALLADVDAGKDREGRSLCARGAAAEDGAVTGGRGRRERRRPSCVSDGPPPPRSNARW